MKKIIKTPKEGICQITIADERWYLFEKDKGEHEYYPSTTWICSYYPKGIAFHKWLASKGWDEAEAIKVAAGDKGSKVHKAIEDLLDGKEVKMNSKYVSPATDKEEELSLEEYECLMSFQAWHSEVKPRLMAKELIVSNKEYGYAGTVDFICEIEGKIWVIDFKTSQNVWPEHELQVSAYAHALRDAYQHIDKLGILQLGYRKNKKNYNKKNYKLTEVEDKFDLFLAARQIWANETKDVKPLKRDYPLTLTLEELSDDAEGTNASRI